MPRRMRGASVWRAAATGAAARNLRQVRCARIERAVQHQRVEARRRRAIKIACACAPRGGERVRTREREKGNARQPTVTITRRAARLTANNESAWSVNITEYKSSIGTCTR